MINLADYVSILAYFLLHCVITASKFANNKGFRHQEDVK